MQFLINPAPAFLKQKKWLSEQDQKDLKIFGVVQISDICISTYPIVNNKENSCKMLLKIQSFNSSFEPAKQKKQTNAKAYTNVQILWITICHKWYVW